MLTIKRFLYDDSGTTAIEYGLIAGLVAVAIIGTLIALGGSLNGLFTTVGGHLDDASGP